MKCRLICCLLPIVVGVVLPSLARPAEPAAKSGAESNPLRLRIATAGEATLHRHLQPKPPLDFYLVLENTGDSLLGVPSVGTARLTFEMVDASGLHSARVVRSNEHAYPSGVAITPGGLVAQPLALSVQEWHQLRKTLGEFREVRLRVLYGHAELASELTSRFQEFVVEWRNDRSDQLFRLESLLPHLELHTRIDEVQRRLGYPHEFSGATETTGEIWWYRLADDTFLVLQWSNGGIASARQVDGTGKVIRTIAPTGREPN